MCEFGHWASEPFEVIDLEEFEHWLQSYWPEANWRRTGVYNEVIVFADECVCYEMWGQTTGNLPMHRYNPEMDEYEFMEEDGEDAFLEELSYRVQWGTVCTLYHMWGDYDAIDACATCILGGADDYVNRIEYASLNRMAMELAVSMAPPRYLLAAQ